MTSDLKKMLLNNKLILMVAAQEALWREMKDAPEVEGAEIIACNRKYGGRPSKFVWKEKPHMIGKLEFPVEVGWHAREEGIIIRRSYQDQYVWVPLPVRSALHRSQGI